MSFTELAQNYFRPDDLDLAILLLELPADHIPACRLQLNVIESGLILACAAHHFAVDFGSMKAFLSAIHQGSKAYFHGFPLPTFPVSLDRTPFNAQPVPEGVSKQDSMDQCPKYRVIDLKQALNCRSNNVNLADYQMKLYETREASIVELKGQCLLSEGVKYVPSFDCISAALWKYRLPPNEKLRFGADFERTGFLVNSWFVGAVEYFDFGAGLPQAFRPKPNPLRVAFCMFLPSFRDSSKGTRELLIQLRAKEHEMLMEDDFFSKYFKLVSYPAL